ncbi:N-6 DNA methylase, partial [Streptococcus gordonii]|nr:N-6 DNA methylase [Streptococcus gordonii]
MQRELQSGGWFDAFGDLFMAISSKSGRQVNGQFFTPPDICDLMVLCTDSGETAAGKRICDPTCGSGRLLLAY